MSPPDRGFTAQRLPLASNSRRYCLMDALYYFFYCIIKDDFGCCVLLDTEGRKGKRRGGRPPNGYNRPLAMMADFLGDCALDASESFDGMGLARERPSPPKARKMLHIAQGPGDDDSLQLGVTEPVIVYFYPRSLLERLHRSSLIRR